MKKPLIALAALTLSTAMAGTAFAAGGVPAGKIPHVSVSTLLGSRVTAQIPNQPSKNGQSVTTSKPFSCGASSGNCSVIYQEVSSPAKYQFTSLGYWPKNVVFHVTSAGPGTTAGTFTVNLNDIGLHEGQNLLITGDSYQRSGCTTLKGGSGAPLQLCPGQS
jgi:hypothetical protein